jgi:hypothetical protein
MLDTSRSSARRYQELLEQAEPVERLAQAARLTQAVRNLALLGIRRRHPTAAENETRARLAVRLYGRSLAERFFGPVPDDAV